MFKVYRVVSYIYSLLLVLLILVLSFVLIKEGPEDFIEAIGIIILAAFSLYCIISFTYQTSSLYSKKKQNFETIDSLEIPNDKTASIRNYNFLNTSNIFIGAINTLIGLISLISVDFDIITPYDVYFLIEDIILLFLTIYSLLFGLFQIFYTIEINKLYYKN